MYFSTVFLQYFQSRQIKMRSNSYFGFSGEIKSKEVQFSIKKIAKSKYNIVKYKMTAHWRKIKN